MTRGKISEPKKMKITDLIMNGPMITIVGILAHEIAHAYGMKDGGGAYRFQALIEKMYQHRLWAYEDVEL
jgi:predicted metalloprotease with PDZ domain